MLQPEVSVFFLSEQKVLWARKESWIFTPFHISRLVICEVGPHFFARLKQPEAGTVARSWLGSWHCHWAGIKPSVLQLLHFTRLQPCWHLWLTALSQTNTFTITDLPSSAKANPNFWSCYSFHPCGMYMWDRNSKGQTHLCLISQKATILPSFGAKDSLMSHLFQGFISKIMCYSKDRFPYGFLRYMFLSSIIHKSGWICMYLLHALGQSWNKKGFTPSYLLLQHCNIESILIFFSHFSHSLPPVSSGIIEIRVGGLTLKADLCHTLSSLLGLSLVRTGSACSEIIGISAVIQLVRMAFEWHSKQLWALRSLIKTVSLSPMVGMMWKDKDVLVW